MRRPRHLMLTVLCLLVALVTLDCTPPACASLDAAEVVSAVNAARRDAGLSCLQMDMQLGAAAQNHSLYMALNSELTHSESRDLPGFTGVSPGDRIQATGLTVTFSGELVAGGHGTATAVTEAFLGSPEHLNILLNAHFDSLGVGREGNYWTVTLARIPPE